MRSRANFSRFVAEYQEAVFSDFESYYAIGKTLSEDDRPSVQAVLRSHRCTSAPAPAKVIALFNSLRIEAVFTTLEYAFDAAKLRTLIASQLALADVEFETATFVERLIPEGQSCRVICKRHGEQHELSASTCSTAAIRSSTASFRGRVCL